MTRERRKLQLSWIGVLRQWRKRYKGKSHYLGTGRGRSDRESYQRALEKWRQRKAEIDYTEIHGAPPLTAPPLLVTADTRPHRGTRSIRKAKKGTLAFARDLYLDEARLRYDEGALSASRLNSVTASTAHFGRVIGSEIRLRDMDESIVSQYFTACREEMANGTSAATTTKLRLQSVSQFIKWMWRERHLNTLPRNLSKLHLKQPQLKILAYTAPEVQAIFEKASPRLQCYIALACNCGFTQADIAALKRSEYDRKAGRIIHRRTKTGVLTNHKLWSITESLIHAHEAPPNEHDLLFISPRGHAMRTVRLDGKSYKYRDTIAGMFRKFRDRHGYGEDPRSFKTFRKTSATLLEQIAPGVAPLFLGHLPASVAQRHYVVADQTALDRALDSLGSRYVLGANLLSLLSDTADDGNPIRTVKPAQPRVLAGESRQRASSRKRSARKSK